MINEFLSYLWTILATLKVAIFNKKEETQCFKGKLQEQDIVLKACIKNAVNLIK